MSQLARYGFLAWAVSLTLAVDSVHAETATAEDVSVEISPLATTGPIPEPIEPVDQQAIRAAIVRGVEFLLEDQRPSGGWGSAEKTKGLNIYAPVPGSHHAFRAAVTGLVLEALVEAEPRLDGELKTRVGEAIDRGEKWLLENAGIVRRGRARGGLQQLGAFVRHHRFRRPPQTGQGRRLSPAKPGGRHRASTGHAGEVLLRQRRLGLLRF